MFVGVICSVAFRITFYAFSVQVLVMSNAYKNDGERAGIVFVGGVCSTAPSVYSLLPHALVNQLIRSLGE